MMFEATGCYGEMTLNKFSFGIANNSESNMFQYGNPPWIFYLVNFVHACAEKFETTDEFLKQSCYCEMMLNKFCFGIANNSESNMFQYGNTPLNILSCQFRACLCRKLWNYWWVFEATGCYCEMMLNKFCFGIANNSESNMFQNGNTPLNILSCQFRACRCPKLLMIFEATGR